ncbi:hypothetical protein DCCM_2177 [Desulfocucumis palustris]|uniref:Uncharacterized protein n=1 Tax=Desulfocucumis palustris TaxID=1898651 RepID=A0A2L2XAG8_9FIRM|nr:hypothetical protein DCCM_2177 [Desulfocucumis palustris]
MAGPAEGVSFGCPRRPAGPAVNYIHFIIFNYVLQYGKGFLL